MAKNKSATPPVNESTTRSFIRHILGLVIGSVILIFILSLVVSYGIFSNGAINVSNVERLGQQMLNVAQGKASVKVLLPNNYTLPGGTTLNTDLLPAPQHPPQELPKAENKQEVSILPFTKEKQFTMSDYDSLGRSVKSHIQLQFKDMASQEGLERPQKINYNPVGWHNYKFTFEKEGKTGKAWLLNRGHLVGYQFCGINDDGRNLFPETAWTNAGDYEGMDDTNQQGQLYYENRLARWLKDHPSDWLDLEVMPLYRGEQLVPDRIRLKFIGLSKDGKKIPITIPSSYASRLVDGGEEVILSNSSPNAVINYATGQATER
ncbi:DNA/RNA non-specific endonuclease [Lactococcus formosensis subsp. bovis]|uniref:DNA/RNA non-specific endonuclease n=1 Tax=Lactococcus formosensis TaxID=1281486 RepID=UPI001BCE253D|nr:DNA/RNA non-specific endonuclease [Lactococcus formosensis]